MTGDPMAPFVLTAELGHVLSSPSRLRLIHLLCQCDRTVEKLAEAMKEPVANVSHHLQVLLKAHMVATTRIGRHVAYGIASNDVRHFWQIYRDFARDHLAELQLLGGALAVQRTKLGGTIDLRALRSLISTDAVLVVDVRPREEFDAGHIVGAISIPLAELDDRIKDLPREKTIVLYCRGPYCLLGDSAQQQFAAQSIHAIRLDSGLIDWANAGLPVEASPGYEPLVKRNSLP
jgi:rhodanese-related sulfurtransferase